jgi:hypothetical protein
VEVMTEEELEEHKFNNLAPEVQREIAKKGAKASAEVRRKKKNMKECLQLLLSLDVKNPKVREQLSKLGIQDEEMTNEMAMMVSALNKATKGYIQAMNFVRDTSGQQVANKVEIDKIPKIVDDIK